MKHHDHSHADGECSASGMREGEASKANRVSHAVAPESTSAIAIGCRGGGCNHSHGDSHAHSHGVTSQVAIAFALLAVILLPIAWSLSLPFAFWMAFIFGGFFAALDATGSLLRGRLTIDTLMVAAGVGAASIGHLPEGALLLTLFSIGHAAEHYAMEHADRSIQSLATLRPLTARRIDPRTHQSRDVPIDEINVGDTVEVQPDSHIPVDGIVIRGQSSVDQSAITGESIPVDKLPLEGFDAKRDQAIVGKDHQVFAGTINGSGTLNVQVTRRNDDSTLARFVRLIAEAKTQRSPSQRLTEVFERWYVPAVMALVCILVFAFMVIDETFKQSLYRAMAVLVAASPCALAIATPSAVLSAIACAGREGVLIKGGGPLEMLGQVTAIAFDKTGTLTTGRPEVVDIYVTPGVTREQLIATAARVQRMINHPLAHAIVRADRSIETATTASIPVSDIHRIAGQGVKAKLGDEEIAIGNAKLFADSAGASLVDFHPCPDTILTAERTLRERGQTIVIVRLDGEYLGVIGLVDTPRPDAAKTLEDLRTIGVRRMVMLSGDHHEAVNAIASALLLDGAKGDLLPEEKVHEIAAMAISDVTAMVGDGANDAPAMAAASVSIAMGAAGSDIALQTADIALMGDDLSKLPFTFGLGKAATRIIRQNLWISLGTIAFLVPATIVGFKLGAAVVLHEGSTVVVVANALRLLRYRS